MRLRSVAPVLALALACTVVVGCEEPEPSVVGQWSAVDHDMDWIVELREDSTWSMQAGALSGEGTYTAIPDREGIYLRPTGRLADVVPDGYRARLEADTLRLCREAHCTDMVRVEP